MPDTLKIANATMKALSMSYGSNDAVAALINARFGINTCAGTISKKMSGVLQWTIVDALALEDGAGQYPITGLFSRRLAENPEPSSGCLVQHSASIAKEAGEAVAAVLKAAQSACSGEHATAVRELDEVEAAIKAARARLAAAQTDT